MSLATKIEPVLETGQVAYLPLLLTILSAALLGWAMESAFRKRYGGPIQPWLIVLPVLEFALLLWRYGFGPELLQGMVLCLTLLYASAADLRIREVPDSLPLVIAVAALIGRTPDELPLMFLAAIVVTIPQLAVVIMKPGSYGGADIKIMAAGAFVQGSSIELSADGPIKPPYAVYFQGGLTYPHAKLGILMSLEKLVEAGIVTLPE